MKKYFPLKPSLRIVLIYIIVGTLWILFSDLLMDAVIPPEHRNSVSIAKGWLFIGVTSLLLTFLIQRHEASRDRLVSSEITGRKLLEEAQKSTIELLRICNRTSDRLELMRELIRFFQDLTGCEAVGVRLREGDDFPYYETRGFSDTFVKAENCLCARDPKGELIRDHAGHPALDCMCGNVLCGRFDPSRPFFSQRGSFWSNSTTELLATTTEDDRQAKTRNRCNGEGYESVALVPLHVGDEIFGLFQFNDRRRGLFTPQKISLLEDLVSYVAIALAKLRTDEERVQLQQQLYQSQKIEAIGQLAGGVAHDFNNILSVIMGYGQMLRMGRNLDSQQKEKLDQIIAASERAAQLTGGLLAFSRKQILSPRVVNLNDLVKQLQKFLVRVIGEDIELVSKPAEAELPVNVDSSQIDQVLVNLATNARDAMPQGGILTIETTAGVIDAPFIQRHGYGRPGRYAVVTVSDTGSGMGEETQKRIFEPFFTTKEPGKGTGLGLAVVSGIVAQHNGFIDLRSEPGKGTRFRVYLPLLEGGVPHREKPCASEPPRGQGETILVAEDESILRGLVTSILTGYGYNVLQAADGEAVVEQFRANRERICMVLMDMIMPKQSGKAAEEEIRKLQPEAKVLFISGYTADFISSRGLDEEGLEFIMKPFQPRELLCRVRELLDRGGMASATGSAAERLITARKPP